MEALRFSDTKIRSTVSFDAYFLLRYMKILVVICFAGCLLTWTVLLPISSTGDQGEEQLQKFSLFNNSSHSWKKFYANVACAWVFVGKS